jgi:anti-sigma regulatory factor (Ser/Thr protein kinase)
LTQQDPKTLSSQSALTHEALLYTSAEGYGNAVADFARTAADAGEPILAVLPPASRPLVESAIQASGADCRFEDMTERARNPGCLLQIQQDWIRDNSRPVRLISEPLWPGRSPAEVVEVFRHEALVNYAMADARASLLCPYDAEHLSADALEGAQLTHPWLINEGLPEASPLYRDPLDTFSAHRWPQPPPREPVDELPFTGDLHALRQAVSDDRVAGSLGRGRRGDLVFVINEAATNAVKHCDGRCTVRLWQDGPTVISEVRTEGPPLDALAGRIRPSDEALGGRGLWLINQLCDLVELRCEEQETSLRMHLLDRAA